MDINQWSMPWPPPRASAPIFIRHLAKLPRETVHQIYNDLPVVKILQILSSRIQYLQDCVITHLHYQHLFKEEDIADLLVIFELYREAKLFTKVPLADSRSILAHHYDSARRGNPITLQSVRVYMTHYVSDTLDLSTIDWELLRPYFPEALALPLAPLTYGQDSQVMWARWELIKNAKLRLGAAKYEQLNLTADLIAQYPGKIKLKKPLDPSQDGPRPNVGHIENYFRTRARKVKNDRCLKHKDSVRCADGVDLADLVPYNKCLWVFLDTLERYPPENKDIDAHLKRFRNLSLYEAEPEATPKDYQYPPNITASIEVVMAGLSYLYADMPHQTPRITWAATYATVVASVAGSFQISKERFPRFYVERKPHAAGLPPYLHRCPVKKVKCYDEREFVWLKAFLETVTWMEENLPLQSE